MVILQMHTAYITVYGDSLGLSPSYAVMGSIQPLKT